MITCPNLNFCNSSSRAWRYQRQDSQGMHKLITVYALNKMYCKSLWIKSSAKCIIVNLAVMKTTWSVIHFFWSIYKVCEFFLVWFCKILLWHVFVFRYNSPRTDVKCLVKICLRYLVESCLNVCQCSFIVFSYYPTAIKQYELEFYKYYSNLKTLLN